MGDTFPEEECGLAVELDDVVGKRIIINQMSLVPLFVVQSHRDSIRLVTGIQFLL